MQILSDVDYLRFIYKKFREAGAQFSELESIIYVYRSDTTWTVFDQINPQFRSPLCLHGVPEILNQVFGVNVTSERMLVMHYVMDILSHLGQGRSKSISDQIDKQCGLIRKDYYNPNDPNFKLDIYNDSPCEL